jgi:hypothetical protein
LSVIQNEHAGYGFPGFPNPPETGSFSLAEVGKAVMKGPVFNCPLVIEEKAG